MGELPPHLFLRNKYKAKQLQKNTVTTKQFLQLKVKFKLRHDYQ